MSFKTLLSKQMLLLILILYMIIGYFGFFSQGGINKTVGWMWDLTNILFYLGIFNWLLYPVGYTVLAFMKYRTHPWLSGFHLLSILVVFLMSVFDNESATSTKTHFLFYMLTLALFALNFRWAVRNKGKEKPVAPKKLQ